MKRLLFSTVCLLLVSSLALAQAKSKVTSKKVQRYGGIACGSDPILPTDGNIATIYDFVAASSSAYYLVNLKDGHSYSAEVYDSTDPTVVAGSAQLSLIAAADCTTVLTTQDVANYDPDLSGSFAARISWIQTGNVSAVLVLKNSDANDPYNYNIRIADTTLHNPRWSTFAGFITQYALVNNTSHDIAGTLTLTSSTGTSYSSQVTIPAGGEKLEQTSDLGIPPTLFGFATFAYVGPAGAITADADFINPSGTVIVPSTFAPRDYQH